MDDSITRAKQAVRQHALRGADLRPGAFVEVMMSNYQPRGTNGWTATMSTDAHTDESYAVSCDENGSVSVDILTKTPGFKLLPQVDTDDTPEEDQYYGVE